VAERHRPCTTLTTDEFLDRPFYFDLSVDSLMSTHGRRFDLTRYLRRVDGKQGAKDTIYRYHHKNTSLVFYTTPNGSVSFLTSKVGDPSLELRNCIRIGMPRVRLEERMTDFPSDFRDTVTIQNNLRQAAFIFEKSRLKEVFINNYFR